MRGAVCASVLFLGGCAGDPPATHFERSATALAPLPENLGLAARYPDDQGVRTDMAVVLADDVETSTGATLLDRWDNAWGRVLITRDPAHVHAGGQALEFSTQPPGGAGVSKYLSSGFDRLFLRYYIKYDEVFPGAHHVGGVLGARPPGERPAPPGIKPDGTNRFDVMLDHWSFDPKVPAPGYLVAYVYHMDQQHQWGEQFYPSGMTQPGVNAARRFFGSSFAPRPNFLPARDRWYCYELMVQANTPGQRDGRIAFWVDGGLAADFPNLRFRSVESLKLNRADFGLHESRTGTVRRVWIDDVVGASTYIGPMTK
jgi:hypothetical protein